MILIESKLELWPSFQDLVNHDIIVGSLVDLVVRRPVHVRLEFVGSHELGATGSPFLEENARKSNL